ncbi:CopD family protein [Halosegnis marinus]|uniref:CopD family protein n=1 Tax=Halosegnis marinus TaxID=3034023 RepID=A0ABD5ZL59_9EURY|nr:CopD family protein [Halosegnis sp. DT85]
MDFLAVPLQSGVNQAVLSVSYVLHMVFAAALTGSVLYVALFVNPAAVAGDIGNEAFARVTGGLTTVSRASAVVLLLTGGHQAGNLYTFESLVGSPRGHLVLTMLVLWVAMTALVEIAGARLRRGLDAGKLREPAREAKPFLRGAAALAVLLLIDAGLLAGGLPF